MGRPRAQPIKSDSSTSLTAPSAAGPCAIDGVPRQKPANSRPMSQELCQVLESDSSELQVAIRVDDVSTSPLDDRGRVIGQRRGEALRPVMLPCEQPRSQRLGIPSRRLRLDHGARCGSEILRLDPAIRCRKRKGYAAGAEDLPWVGHAPTVAP